MTRLTIRFVKIKVNRVAYGKQHHLKIRRMPCFDVNSKLGTEDGEAIKKISTASSNKAAIDAYEKEMDSSFVDSLPVFKNRILDSHTNRKM
ncbi:hypothetical protein DPMN_173800 [Dreissena polymorpha]|uniref:Uncharacterized protein n=1 Tax=Dreissena polymorpha TaxID=45954 RepID=A0A9D4IHA0_DREPO|nr:hypothetical protein DPMN_173800 [Dreissena polymorpha]